MELQGVKNTELVVQTKNEQQTEVVPKAKDLQPDKFTKNNVDATKVLTAGVTASTGLIAGKNIGGKLANGVEKLAVELCDDFGKTIEKIPQQAKGVIKWGSAIGLAVLVGMGFLKDNDKNGKVDLLETMNTVLIGESAEI